MSDQNNLLLAGIVVLIVLCVALKPKSSNRNNNGAAITVEGLGVGKSDPYHIDFEGAIPRHKKGPYDFDEKLLECKLSSRAGNPYARGHWNFKCGSKCTVMPPNCSAGTGPDMPKIKSLYAGYVNTCTPITECDMKGSCAGAPWCESCKTVYGGGTLTGSAGYGETGVKAGAAHEHANASDRAEEFMNSQCPAGYIWDPTQLKCVEGTPEIIRRLRYGGALDERGISPGSLVLPTGGMLVPYGRPHQDYTSSGAAHGAFHQDYTLVAP